MSCSLQIAAAALLRAVLLFTLPVPCILVLKALPSLPAGKRSPDNQNTEYWKGQHNTEQHLSYSNVLGIKIIVSCTCEKEQGRKRAKAGALIHWGVKDSNEKEKETFWTIDLIWFLFLKKGFPLIYSKVNTQNEAALHKIFTREGILAWNWMSRKILLRKTEIFTPVFTSLRCS